MEARPAIPAKQRNGAVACPKWVYRCQHLVENHWARLKEWRAVATSCQVVRRHWRNQGFRRPVS